MELPVYMVIVGKGQLYSNALLNLEGNIYSQSKSPTFNAFVFNFSFQLYWQYLQIEASGGCLLYGSIKPVNSTSFTTTAGQKVNCNFPIYVGVFGCIFYGLGMGMYNLYAIYTSRKDPCIV